MEQKREAESAAYILERVGQLMLVLVMYPLFFIWAPWIAARPVGELPDEVVRTLPPGCSAAAPNHGTYGCCWCGTIESNPLGFAVCSAVLFGYAAYLAVGGLSELGFGQRGGGKKRWQG
jgi:hypothetical protein